MQNSKIAAIMALAAVVLAGTVNVAYATHISAFGLSVSTDKNTAASITLPAVTDATTTFVIDTNPASGVLSGFNATAGTVTYTPNADFVGNDSFTFHVESGADVSAPATVTVQVVDFNANVSAYRVFVNSYTSEIVAKFTNATSGAIVIPDESLAGKPVNPADPTLVFSDSISLYDLMRDNPRNTGAVIDAAYRAGIDFNQLSPSQQVYLILSVTFR